MPRWVNRSATLALGKSAPRAAPAAPAPPGALTPDARKFQRCISLTPSLPRRRSEALRVSFDPYVRVEKCAKPTLEERAACWHGADAKRRFVADEHARRVAEGLPCDGSLLLAARDAYAGDCDDSDDDGSFGDDGDERAWDEAKADPGEAKTASPLRGFRAPPPSPRVTFIHGHGVGVSPKAMSAALTSIAVSAVAKDAKDVSGFLLGALQSPTPPGTSSTNKSRSEADDESETVVSNASQQLYASASPERVALSAVSQKGPPPVPRVVPETDEAESEVDVAS